MGAGHHLRVSESLDSGQDPINFLAFGELVEFLAGHPIGVFEKRRTTAQNLLVVAHPFLNRCLDFRTLEGELPLGSLLK